MMVAVTQPGRLGELVRGWSGIKYSRESEMHSETCPLIAQDKIC
jgi:hypothetical protein